MWPVIEQLEHRQLLAAGDLDPTFGNAGVVLTTSEGPGYNLLNDSAVLLDGKVVAVGMTGDDFVVARYGLDGKLDPTFGTDGYVRTDFGHKETANAVAIQSDGKIVVAGERHGVWPDRKIALARYNPDGSLDPAFGSGGKVLTPSGWSATDVAIAPGGKIVLTGAVQRPSGNTDPVELHVWRYNEDGSLDTTFDGDGQAYATVGIATPQDHVAQQLAVQPDGKILVVGRSWNGADANRLAVARFNDDGSLDTTFDGDGTLITEINPFSDYRMAIAAAPDGKFVVASGGGSITVARYDGDGSPDETFDGDGKLEWSEGTTWYPWFQGALAVRDDGKVLVGIRAGIDRDVTIARLNADGSFDSGFGVGGKSTFAAGTGSSISGIPSAIGFHPTDGSIVVGATVGTFYTNASNYGDFFIVRLDSLGTRVEPYGGLSDLPGPMQDYGRLVAYQLDGKILAAGITDRGVHTNRSWVIARHLLDGSLDASFGTRGIVRIDLPDSDTTLAAMRTQDDGKIIVAGTLGYFADETVVARINPDGTLDGAFHGDGLMVTDKVQGGVADAFPQPDGRIIVAGRLYDPVRKIFLAAVRFNADGTLDGTFGVNGGVGFPSDLPQGTSIATAALQPDGKAILAGQNAVLRFNPDWTLDTTFDGDGHALTGGATVRRVELDSAGRLVLFESRLENSTFTYTLRRLNPDGSADASFAGAGLPIDPTWLPEHWIDVALDAHDRIVLVGNLVDEYNETRIITMRRLADGTPDVTFGDAGFVTALPWPNYETVTGAAGVIVNPADGKILVFGQTYNVANGTRDLALLRYTGSTPLAAHPGGTYEVIEGGSVTLTGSGTSNVPITKYEWDLDNDGTFETEGASATFLAAAFDGVAQRIVAFRVTDASGQTHTRHATINVENAPPAITLSGPPRADAGVPYPLSITYSDPATAAGLTDTIQSVTIDWGDGTVETISGHPDVVTHTYSDARAVYQVHVSARDEDGAYAAEHSVNEPRTLDYLFGKNGGVTARAAGGELFPLPDGTFIHAAGNTLTRYFAHGQRDMRFGDVTIPSGLTAAGYAITPEGKVLVVGTEFQSSGPDARGRMFVARYTIAGRLDESFGGGVGIAKFDLSGMGLDLGSAVAALPDGKILVAGATQMNPNYVSTTRAVLLRLNSDGSLDSTYGQGGKSITNYAIVPSHLVVAPSGRTFLAGKGQSFTIIAYDAGGALDTSFGNNGNIYNTSFAGDATFALDADGNLLITGWGWSGGNALTRYRPDGTLDTTFGEDGTARVNVQGYYAISYADIAFDADGGILLLGSAHEDTDAVNHAVNDLIVTRFLNDGDVDLSYGDAGSILLDVLGDGSSETAHSLVVLPTGKLLVSASNSSATEPTNVTPLILRLGEARLPVNANNTAPSISVDDLTLSPAAPKEGETFTLSGTITDPDAADAHTVTIEWGYFGPDVTPPTVLHLAPGVLTFEATHSFPEDSIVGSTPYAWPIKITVSDGLLEASVRDTITVVNADPTADAGPDKSAKENELVQLTGAATDPGTRDEGSLSYRWKVTGPSLGINGTQLDFHTKDISFVPGQVGTYTATLTVTDPGGGTHTDTATITVTDSRPEIRLLYDEEFPEGAPVRVSSWYNGDIVSRNWTVTDADGDVIHTSTSGSIEFPAPDEGTYTVRVDYADDEGNSDFHIVTLGVINVAPQLPPLDLTIKGTEGVPIRLALTATDPGPNDTLTYLWEILDGQQKVLASSDTDTIEFTLSSGDYYLARLTVTDGDGGIVIRQAEVNIDDVPPTIGITGSTSVPEGAPYTLGLHASDPGDVTIRSWTINWGDGTVETFEGNPSSVTHTYADGPNTYPIVATAADAHGFYTVRTRTSTNPLDTTFGNAGIVNTQMNGAHDRVTGIVVQPDGKVIAVGSAGNPIRTGIVRYNFNGSRDTSFFPAGTLANTFGGEAAVALLPGGMVAVAASSSIGGIDVVRLNPSTGAILTRTNVGAQHTTYVGYGQIHIHTLPDGRFYVAGRGGGGYMVARMTAAGALDETFGVRRTPLPASNHQLHDVVVQDDGKIVLGGATQLADGYGAILVRYNTDGTLDTTFGGGDGIVTQSEGFTPLAMILLPDGRILAAEAGRLARFNADGSQDTTFGTDGFHTVSNALDWVQDLFRDDAGRYVLVTLDHQVVRLNADLTLDRSFGTDGIAQVFPGGSYGQTVAAALTPTGDVVIGGAAGTANVDTNFWLARFLTGLGPVTVTDVRPTITITGDATVADGAPYTMNLAASDPGADTITSWIINWGDGTPVQTITGNPSSVTHTFADGPGQYAITASVVNEDGAHGSGTFNVYVTPVREPFFFGDADLSLDRESIPEGDTVNLSGSFSDTRGVHDVTIDWGDGSTPTTLALARGVTTFAVGHRYLDEPPGDESQYVITVLVHNGLESLAASKPVTVVNVPPTVSAGPDRTVREGDVVTLTADVTDAGTLDQLTYFWEIKTAVGATFPTGSEASFSFTPPDAGAYTVRLTVRDGDGGVRTDTMIVTASEARPTITARASAPSITEGGVLTLTLDASDPGAGDAIIDWTIDWGDGSPLQVRPGGEIYAGHLYPDGPLNAPIVVRARDADGTYFVPVTRLGGVGAIDTSFGGGDGRLPIDVPGYTYAHGHDIAIQPDGKAIVVGTVYPNGPYDGNADGVIVRLNPDGSLDTSFGAGGHVVLDLGSANTGTGSVALAPDGKIVVTGSYGNPGTPPSNFVARYNADGAPDTSFGAGGTGRATHPALTSAVQAYVLPDGSILVAGSHAATGVPPMMAVTKYTPSGALDAAFGANGIASTRVGTSNDQTFDLDVAEDGKIVLVGSADSAGAFDWGLARFNADGTLDTSFDGDGRKSMAWNSTGGAGLPGGADGVKILPDGRIVVAGIYSEPGYPTFAAHMLVTRLNDDGSLDDSFGDAGKFVLPDDRPYSEVRDLAIDDAGRILLADAHDGLTVIRLTPDGDLDPSFGPWTARGIATTRLGATSIDGAYGIAIDNEGRIWLAGNSRPSTTSSTGSIAVARFSGHFRVNNAAPHVSIPPNDGRRFSEHVVPVGVKMPLILAGSFTDPGDDTWTATVNYGDGTPVQPLTLNPDKTFNLEHTYARTGRYRITVIVTDSDGAKGSRSVPVHVRDASFFGTQRPDTLDVRLTPDGEFVEFFENAPLTGAPTFVLPIADAGTLTVSRGYGNDRIIIHNGTFNIRMVEPSGFTLINHELVLSNDAAVTIVGNNEFRAIELNDASRLSLEAAAKTLRTSKLTVNGTNATLDVLNGALGVPSQSHSAAALEALVRSARNAGTSGHWTGPGLTSSAAQANPLTTLAVGLSGDDLLMKYTYNGDANLDGIINADDYFRIDSGFLAQPADPLYDQGDFNYDGKINADDYFLIDSAFLGQGEPLAISAPETATLATNTMARAVPAEPEQERTRKRPVRPIFSDQPVSVLGPAPRAGLARRR